MRYALYAGLLIAAAGAMFCLAIDWNPEPTFTEVGGSYTPVTADQLTGRSSGARTGLDEFDFKWSFREGTFSLTGTNIPPDLLQAFHDGSHAESIQGDWSLTGETLTFENVTVDGQPSSKQRVKLHCFFTGVIRIETGAAQYVF